MSRQINFNGAHLEQVLQLLRVGNEAAFESLYDLYARPLFCFVYSKVRNKDLTEEIIQELFVSLWTNRETIQVNTSMEAYLFGAAKNKILSCIRSAQVRQRYVVELTRFAYAQCDNSAEERMNVDDLQQTVQTKISELPHNCRVAFQLSRVEHQSISQIAEKMNISTRTVGNYISRALRHLRSSSN